MLKKNSNGPHYFQLDLQKSIVANLAGLTLIEFPSFLVRFTPMDTIYVDEKPVVDYYMQAESRLEKRPIDIDEDGDSIALKKLEETADILANSSLEQAFF
jgi:hypothetical protein